MLTVIGGTYTEICLNPRWNEVFGSGLRAAVAMSDIAKSLPHNNEVRLHSWASDEEQRKLRTLIRHSGITAHFYPRKQAIEWQYDHSLAVPRLYPEKRDIVRPDAIPLSADKMLAFGLVECNPNLSAKMMVFDPQASDEAIPLSVLGYKADKLAIVCNLSEACAIARFLGLKYNTKSNVALSVGKAILKREGAEVVVVKNGVRGATVITHDGSTLIPSHRTKTVFPIGSGDVFSGIFALHWMEMGNSPAEAARWASVATASYCSTVKAVIPGNLPEVEKSLHAEESAPRTPNASRPQSVYLAGPLFTLPQLWFLEESKRCLEEQGLSVFSPKDEVGFLKEIQSAAKVAGEDLAGLRRCGVVFAILDGLDPGTIFEIGYAVALRKKKVIAFAERTPEQDLTMLRGTGCEIHGDFATAIYRTAWYARNS